MKNRPSRLAVPLETGAATTALVYQADGSPDTFIDCSLILGHGAGAGQQSAFMVGFAHALSDLGIDVVTFNFPYTEQKRRIPDRGPVLEACFRSVIGVVRAHLPSAARRLFIGGKSMGGRIATQLAASDSTLMLDGLVLLGYPLHPPGKPMERRDKHFGAIGRPMLFVQGSRDAFGTPSELDPALQPLSPRPTLHVVDGGDHSFKVPKKDPQTQAAVYADVQQTMVGWMAAVIAAKRGM